MAGYIGKSQSVVLTDIDDDSIETADIKDGAVTADKLAAGAAVPDQTGQSGKYLTTDGTTASWGTVNTDLVDDTSPQLGGDLASNGNDINFGDNDKAIFGAGSDLQIYHDGSNSFISESGTGNLKILTNTLQIKNSADTEIGAKFIEDGAVTLYHNNSQKLNTTSTGIDVTGDLSVSGSIAGAGKVLQVVNVGTYNNQSFATSSYSNISLLNASITPTSSSSKIMLLANIHGSTDGNAYIGYKVYRNGVDQTAGPSGSPGAEIMFGGSPGVNGYYQLHQHTFQWIDSPNTTSSTAYSIWVSPQRSNNYSWRLNQSINRGDDNQYYSCYSSVILLEIAA